MVTSTRDALLAAARKEFAAYGVAGARVDRIAASAGVNKERIYGYFGSKEKLFDIVVEEALSDVAELHGLIAEDPVEYVERLYDFYAEHSDVLRLIMWEALNYREDDLPGTELQRQRCADKIELLAKGLGTDVSPEVGRTMLTLIGLAAWPTAMPQLVRLIAGEGAQEGMREHVVAFTRAALANRPS
jgi:AcrR family transcriptional regulator